MSRVYEAMCRAAAPGVIPAPSATSIRVGTPVSAPDVRRQDASDVSLGNLGSRNARRRTESNGRVRQEEIKLVQRLFLTAGSENRRTVLFAGVEHENGCAAVCARAGQTLVVHQSGSVCLIDANLRVPSLHELFGVANRTGLASALSEPGPDRHMPVPVSRDNLWLLSSGASTWEPDRLLTRDRLRPHIEALCARFDRVLIAAPPIDTSAETLALSRLVDGVVLIVEAHTTRREAVRNAKTSLDALNVPILGIVLNNRTFPIPEPLYRML